MERSISLGMVGMFLGTVSLSSGSALGQLVPRTTPPKSPYHLVADRPHRMVIKFVDAMKARCNQGQLTAQHQGMLNQVQTVVQTHNLLFTPVLAMPYPQLANLEQRAANRSGKAQPDLGGMMVVHFPQSASEQDVADDLLELNAVEYCFCQLKSASFPEDITPTTPLLEAEQGYRGADPGLDADYVWSKSAVGTAYNGRGKGLKFTDVEGDWNLGHEDLRDSAGNSVLNVILAANPDVPALNRSSYHGTASVGIVSAIENQYGITGLAPEAEVQVSSVFPIAEALPDGSFTLFREIAFERAISQSGPGDVILLELQGGPVYDIPGCVDNLQAGPIELEYSMWLLIRLAVDTDIVVVEAAGNRGMDLDGPEAVLAEWRGWGDSGAILVGAGSPDTDHRWFCGEFTNGAGSNFGSRVDVQGWGGLVRTLGCPESFPEVCVSFSDEHQDYHFFNGTSAASPQVVGACLALQGFFRDRFGKFFDLTAVDGGNFLRDLLRNTGHAQGGLPGEDPEDHHIGPYPNLREAVDTLLGDPSVALPFDDMFPAIDIDEAKWPIVDGGVIDALGVNEPSEPYSMHLGSGQSFESASMVTTDACTTGSSIIQATVDFFSQYNGTGQSPTDDLQVYYRANDESWKVLLPVPPTGSTQYQQQVQAIPSDGLHDAFRVRFENPSATVQWFVDNVTISIVAEPEFRLTPYTNTVCEGHLEDITLEVEVAGGVDTYQWEHDGEAIVGAQTHTYTVEAPILAEDNAGSYTVVATNVCGTVESYPGELIVDIPYTMTPPDGPELPVVCGGSASIHVDVSGSPEPSLQWSYSVDGVAYTSIAGETSDTITLDSVVLGDQGYYKLSTANTFACGGATVESSPFYFDVDENHPACSGAPEILAVISVRDHAGASYGITVDRDVQTGERVTTEPRLDSIQKLQITFNQVMDSATSQNEVNITVTGVITGTISTAAMLATLDASGQALTLTFPGLSGGKLPDLDCYTITLSSAILDAQGESLTGDRDFQIGGLEVDANSDGNTDALDVGYIQARLGLGLIEEDEVRADVNVDGVINALDIGATNARTGYSTCQ